MTADELTPITFEPVFIEKPWGGRKLEEYADRVPEGTIGEMWTISAHPQGDTLVVDGRFAGLPLSEAAAVGASDLVGTRNVRKPFPIMVRYVSSRENLSIQLHPTRSYATKKGMHSGKDETWYVLDTEPGAHVYGGLKTCTRAMFGRYAREGRLDELVITHSVEPGDVISIPAGMVHAICAGISLIEVCENSNTTYRLFDYGRDRGLDLEDGAEVVDIDAATRPHRGLTWQGDGYTHTYLCLNQSFSVSRFDIEQSYKTMTAPETCHVLTGLNGDVVIESGAGTTPIRPGRSVLVPAALGAYAITGSGSVLETHAPDLVDERAALADLLV